MFDKKNDKNKNNLILLFLRSSGHMYPHLSVSLQRLKC